ncbi:glycoside hydrolase family protein [Pedobacter sp. PAMC26386]|nr:glycoside hydrolase family protein [Pedobacter sp. PAMC26386]
MKYSNKLFSFMVAMEGSIPYVYLDNAGYRTVGIGCRVYTTEYDKYSKNNPMPDSLVNSLFWIRAKEYINAVEGSIKVPLIGYQFDALISMAFNIGSAGFINSSLVKAINSGKTGLALKPFFDAWNKSTNQKTKIKSINSILAERRGIEYHLFTTGEYISYNGKKKS